jgi:hypothetical protein
LDGVEGGSCWECPGSGTDVCDLTEIVRELHSSPSESIDALFQRFTVVVNNMWANVDVLPYDYHDRAVKLLHSLDRIIWGEKFEAIVESEKYDTLDSKLEIDSLKASPVVSDEVDCADCSIFLADLALFKEKHASKCEELDVLRVEVAELKSRSALLVACTSCPVLHAKIDEMHAYTSSLEDKLKEPMPTSCSTCEMHALKKLELAHYVDRLLDENDELRKLMGWLSGHEPQLRMMIEAFKRQDGEGLGANNVGEGSGENIQSHQKPTTRMISLLNPTI